MKDTTLAADFEFPGENLRKSSCRTRRQKKFQLKLWESTTDAGNQPICGSSSEVGRAGLEPATDGL